MVAKYCVKCGKKLADTAVFCDECGTLTDTSADVLSSPQITPLSASRRRWELIALGVVIILVGLFIYVS